MFWNIIRNLNFWYVRVQITLYTINRTEFNKGQLLLVIDVVASFRWWTVFLTPTTNIVNSFDLFESWSYFIQFGKNQLNVFENLDERMWKIGEECFGLPIPHSPLFSCLRNSSQFLRVPEEPCRCLKLQLHVKGVWRRI